MRVTVPSPRFVTQTEPAPAAIADGSLPTSTDPSLRPEAGLIRETTPSGSTIQSDPNAESVGRTLPPKKPVAASGRVKATRLYLGSIFETPPLPPVTQTASFVAASAVGASPIGIAGSACPEDTSTRVTLPSSKLRLDHLPPRASGGQSRAAPNDSCRPAQGSVPHTEAQWARCPQSWRRTRNAKAKATVRVRLEGQLWMR